VNDAAVPGRVLVAEHDGVHLMRFIGDVRLTMSAAIDRFVDAVLADEGFTSILIDLTRTEAIDSTSLGILAKLSIRARERFGCTPTLISTNPDITRVVRAMGLDDVFHIVEQPIDLEDEFGDLPNCECTEEETRRRVLEAHRILMSLNENNQSEFRDLVEALEAAAP
jgi:anti-anti-sigma factor